MAYLLELGVAPDAVHAVLNDENDIRFVGPQPNNDASEVVSSTIVVRLDLDELLKQIRNMNDVGK